MTRCYGDRRLLSLAVTHVLHVAEAGVRLEVVVLDLKGRDRGSVRSNIYVQYMPTSK